jgi:hypothetical protein
MVIKNNQSGFGAVEALLVVVIFGIIGGAGWYVMKTNKNIDAINNKTAGSSISSPTTNKTTQTKNSTTFKISELGVELTLAADKTLDGLTYKVIPVDYTYGKSQMAYLSTKTFNVAENGKCDISDAAIGKGTVPPLGFLTKTAGQYPALPTSDNSSGTLVKQFSNYYISWRSPGVSCFDDAILSKQAGDLTSNQLATALMTIVETK